MRKTRIFILLISICFLTAFHCEAESPGKTKMVAGVLMMGAGIGLSVYSLNQCTFFSPSSCYEPQFAIGTGIFAGGAVLLVWGIYDHHHHSKHESVLPASDPVPARRVDYFFSAGPVRKGFAGGFRLRW